MTNRVRKCPKCGNVYHGYPAISREDNKTEICPDCGTKEALGYWNRYIPMAELRTPDVLQEAIETYGKQKQVDMAVEEMSELTKALLKERRAEAAGDSIAWKSASDQVAEEMADVFIMMIQMMEIFENRYKVQKEMDFKLQRLENMLRLKGEMK